MLRKLKILYFLFLVSAVILYSCKSESPLSPENSSNYTKVLTASSSNTKLEIYSATANWFVTGYNDIGFKIFINEQAQTTGYVKFFPKMYHFGNVAMHSSPTSPQYNYNQDKEMFTGYVSFLMITDTNSHWFGFANYNNTAAVDSFTFTVDTSSTAQVKYIYDISQGHSYYLTLVNPFHPKQGPNIFQCILHQSDDDIVFAQIDNAQMFIRPWMEAMGHGSSNNVHPVYKGGGIYEGNANFNMSGYWYVYDSIKVQNNFITSTPEPKFTFDVP
jgi:hypothetical protein